MPDCAPLPWPLLRWHVCGWPAAPAPRRREPPASGRRGVVGPFDRSLPPEHMAALAHGQTLHLMQLAVLDVRRWVENERLRERAL